MSAFARIAEPSSAPADIDSPEADPPEAAAVRLLAEWFSESDTAPPGLAERTIVLCEASTD